MIKKIISISLVMILLNAPAFAQNTVRSPQGRLGIHFKTEKYVPQENSNLTPYELEHLDKIIKKEEQDKKNEIKLAQKQEAQKIKEQKKQEKEELLAKKAEQTEQHRIRKLNIGGKNVN